MNMELNMINIKRVNIIDTDSGSHMFNESDTEIWVNDVLIYDLVNDDGADKFMEGVLAVLDAAEIEYKFKEIDVEP
jgi:hypothetical protein